MQVIDYLFKKREVVKPIIDSYYAAGCAFTDGTHVLAGFQPNKDAAYISGFGGKRLECETYEYTAVRETIEEIFDIEPTYEIVRGIIDNLKPTKPINLTGYMVLQYSFKDLEWIMSFLEKFSKESIIYKVWPKTISDLIFLRSPKPTSEISVLCILPLVKNLEIDSNFKKDVNRISAV
jgi:hypothetical protein